MFNLVALVVIIGGLAWWLVAKALRASTRVVLDEQTKRRRADERQAQLDQRQALLDAISDADDRAAVEAVLRRADWRREHEGQA